MHYLAEAAPAIFNEPLPLPIKKIKKIMQKVKNSIKIELCDIKKCCIEFL